MQDIRFDKVSDDTTILAIGSLFRRIDNSQWGVNLDLVPKAEAGSLRVSKISRLGSQTCVESDPRAQACWFSSLFNYRQH